MSEKQVITLVVDGIRLPLKVSREKEEYFRQAAKMINNKLSEYRGKYSQVDSSALLALTAVQCMAEWLETEDRDEVGRFPASRLSFSMKQTRERPEEGRKSKRFGRSLTKK